MCKWVTRIPFFAWFYCKRIGFFFGFDSIMSELENDFNNPDDKLFSTVGMDEEVFSFRVSLWVKRVS